MLTGIKKISIFIAFIFVTLFSFSTTTFAAGILKAMDETTCLVDGVPTLKCAEILFSNLLVISAGIVLLILFIMLIIGGFTYLTAFGNPESVKKAQGTLKYAVLGLVVYMSSFLILKTIDVMFLGNCGKIFKFQIASDVDSYDPNGCPI